jgi:RNA polymerase sigma-70 factor, ECF subfamily
MSTLPDQELLALIDRARSGDKAAMDDLLRTIRERMKSFFSARAANVAGNFEASDLAQLAILQVFDHLADFKGTTANEFWAWVHTTARRLIAGAARFDNAEKRQVDRTVPLGEDSRGVVNLPAAGPTPSAIVASRELAAVVRAARERLAPEEQLVIRLRDDEEKDWPEIAATLDKTVEAARKFYRRAIKKWADLCRKAGS